MTREQIKYVIQSYRTLFGSDMGQAVLDDLAKHCNADRSSIGPDPHMTYFNEGKRAVYLHIKALLDIPDIEEYLSRYDSAEEIKEECEDG